MYFEYEFPITRERQPVPPCICDKIGNDNSIWLVTRPQFEKKNLNNIPNKIINHKSLLYWSRNQITIFFISLITFSDFNLDIVRRNFEDDRHRIWSSVWFWFACRTTDHWRIFGQWNRRKYPIASMLDVRM